MLPSRRHISMQLFLNLLLRWQDFQQIQQIQQIQPKKCVVQLATSSNIYDLPLKTHTQQVINPTECTPSCNFYILHDPITSNQSQLVTTCLQSNEYKYKGIVFLTHDHIEQYDLTLEFAHASIFVERIQDLDLEYLTVSTFADWNLTRTKRLGTWDLAGGHFQDDHNLQHDVKNVFGFHKENNAKFFFINLRAAVPSIVWTPKLLGVNLHILQEYAKKINISWDVGHDPPGNQSSYVALYLVTTITGFGKHTYPIVHRQISFIVPKETIDIELLNIINVFSWRFWLLILLCYCCNLAYFNLENAFGRRRRPLRMITTMYLLFMQPTVGLELPRGVRARFVVALLLIGNVLYTTLFGFGILHNLLTPSYANDIRSMADMAALQYPIYYHNDPFRTFRSMDEVEVMVFSQWTNDPSVLKNRQRSFQVHYVTDAKISTLLADHTDVEHENIKSLDGTFIAMDDAISPWYAGNGGYLHMNNLNAMIMRTRETGLQMKWEWEAFLSAVGITDIMEYLSTGERQEIHDASVQLTARHLLGAFFILGVGLVIAVLIFCSEVIVTIYAT